MQFKVNKREIYSFSYGGFSPSTIIPNLFSSIPNLECWSEDGLKKLFIGSLELILEFCGQLVTDIDEDLKTKSKNWPQRASAKSMKLKTTLFMKKVKGYIQVAEFLHREQLLKQIYSLILACEGLGPLRGFGMANSFGDKVTGDPERQSIRREN